MSPRRFTISHSSGDGDTKHLLDISHITAWCGSILAVCGVVAAMYSAWSWGSGRFAVAVRPIAREEAVVVVQSHVEGWDAVQHKSLQGLIDTNRQERNEQLRQLSDRLDSQYAAIQTRLDTIISALAEHRATEKQATPGWPTGTIKPGSK
jgi:hypothetical protein